MNIYVIPLDDKADPAKNARLMPLIDQLGSNIEVFGIERVTYCGISNMLHKGVKYLKYLFCVVINGYRNRNNIDIIFCESVYFGFIGVILSVSTKKPLIYDTHDGNVLEHLRLVTKSKIIYKAVKIIEDLVSRCADLIVVLCEQDKQIYNNQKFKYMSKIIVIPSGIDIDTVDNAKEDKTILRKKLNLNIDDIILIFSASLFYILNRNAFIWINNVLAEVLSSKNNKIKILVTGAGNVDVPMHPNIVHVGYVENYFQYLFASDIGLVPYDMHTGTSTKLIDYLTCGLPVICMKSVAGLFPQLEDMNSVLVANNEDEYIQKCLLAISDKNMRNIIGKNGRKVIEKYYNKELVVGLWMDAFKYAIKKRI